MVRRFKKGEYTFADLWREFPGTFKLAPFEMLSAKVIDYRIPARIGDLTSTHLSTWDITFVDEDALLSYAASRMLGAARADDRSKK
jgi:hypothetical protein